MSLNSSFPTMANDLTKGTSVEVSSDEPGFHGAWYVATIIDIVQTPSTPKQNKKRKDKTKMGYLVQYETLYEEDNLDERLTEVVDPEFVRPMPPSGNDGDVESVEFEVNDVVDAFHRDGWWIGIVVKVAFVDDHGECKKKYVVEFENPPEEVEFDGAHMRLHVDWVDSSWKVAPKKTPELRLADKTATHTSEPNNDAPSGFTTPSKPAATADIDNQIAGHLHSTKKKSYSRKKATPEQRLADKTAIHISEPNIDVHSGFMTPSKPAATTDLDNQIADRLGSTKKKSCARKKIGSSSAKSGAVDGSVRNSKKRSHVNSAEEVSSGKTVQPSASVEISGSNGNKEVMMSMMETSGSQAMTQDLTLADQEMIITDTCEAEDDRRQQKGKKGTPPNLPPVERVDDLEDDHERTSDSTAIQEISTDLDEQPLSVWYQGLQSRPVFKRHSCRNPPDHHDESSGAQSPVIVNIGATSECQNIWPFIKRSPLWAAIESYGLYQQSPQKPHFSPLKKHKEDCREGLAIAHMVTYANVVQRISDLQFTDTVDSIQNSLETVAELETHGFNVGAIKARVKELLILKVKVGQIEEEMKKVEKDLEKHNTEKSMLKKECNDIEVKIKELQEKLLEIVSMEKVKDDEIRRLQSNLLMVSNQRMEWELDFEKIAALPL